MRNKIIVVFLLMCFLICSCQGNDEINSEQGDTLSGINTNSSNEQTVSENIITDITRKKEKTFDDFYREIFDEEPHTFTDYSDYDNWEDLYKAYVYPSNGMPWNGAVMDLIYLDGDEIPEFIFYNLKNITIETYAAERKSVNEAYILAYNEYTGKYIVQCNDEDAIEIRNYNSGEVTVECKIECDKNSQHVINYIGCFDEEGYKKLCEHFDLENAKYISRETGYSQIEMLYMIKTGHDSSFNHRYEVIMEDVSFEEAQKRSYEKGGYLAVITSYTELERIKKFLGENVSDIDGVALYVGCEGDGENVNQYWHLNDGTKFRTDAGGEIFVLFPSVLEKSYITGLDEEDILNYGMLFSCINPMSQRNDSDYWAKLFIGPQNMAEYDPNMSGKVGYIIEYDE